MNQTATLAAPQPRVLADVLTHTRVRDAALVIGAAPMTALCAQISIPIPGNLVAFPISAWVCGKLAEKRYDRTPRTALPAFIAGSLIVFAIGVPWLAISADIS